MHCVRDAWLRGNVKSRNGAVGVKQLQHTSYAVGMVLIDDGGTASRRV